MSQEDIPTVFTAGKQKFNPMELLNGNTKPIVKVMTIIAIILTVAVVVVTRDWSGVFRESGVSVEVQRQNAEAWKRIDIDYVRRSEFQQLERRMDRFEEKQDRMIQLQLEDRRRR